MNQAPRGPELTEKRQRRYSRALAGAALSLLIAWASSLLPLPWTLISGVAAVAAVAFLILLLVTAWPTERRRSAVFTAVVGIPACIIFTFSALVTALMYGPVKGYQDCVSTALTQQAVASCKDDLPASITNWLKL